MSSKPGQIVRKEDCAPEVNIIFVRIMKACRGRIDHVAMALLRAYATTLLHISDDHEMFMRNAAGAYECLKANADEHYKEKAPKQ